MKPPVTSMRVQLKWGRKGKTLGFQGVQAGTNTVTSLAGFFLQVWVQYPPSFGVLDCQSLAI